MSDDVNIEGWCREAIDELESFERHELAVALVPERVAVAMWVLRRLGNDPSAKTRDVVRAIASRRSELRVKERRQWEAWEKSCVS